MTQRLSCLTMALLLWPALAQAADVTPPASKRFADSATEEVPQFRKHVVPLLSRLGCNGRACHGSFQGQGGFRLSLFGYDFKMDHDGLSERVDTDDPAESYALQKPTLAEPHEGGKRLEVGSWEYRILLNWIKNGAKPFDPETQPDFVRLHVTPQEILFHGKDETAQLNVIAEWSDGSMEDVTPLCRYSSNNDQIALVDREGLVTSNEPGDSHVVVFFDNGVVPIPVIRPVTDLAGKNYPPVAAPTKIDELITQKLSKLGIVPSEECTDAEFLRRVSLDVTGTLPTASEVRAFIADNDSNKRSKKIDELLERPGYSAWWTTRLCDYTGNNDNVLNNVLTRGDRTAPARHWFDWIHKRVADNVPYDEIMEGIVVGTSREGEESLRDYSQFIADVRKDDSRTYAERKTMPFFWARNNVNQPQDKALAFAYSFMGIRIQCAQCHKHPFDQWTQDDYKQFTNFFTRIQSRNRDRSEYNKILKDVLDKHGKLSEEERKDRRLVQREVQRLSRAGVMTPVEREVSVQPFPKSSRSQTQRKRRNNNSRTFPLTAKLLGDEEVNLEEAPDPRVALMAWLRQKDNPYFAKAFVNRVWANYFNVGIVEPPDDLNLANPPSNAALLNWLADEFVAHDYDMKWLHRTICNSAAYQRSWKPNDTNSLDERNFSREVPRRLPAEVAVDAIAQATASDEKNAEMVTDMDGRAIARVSLRQNNYSIGVFGGSTRESNCDCDRSMEASLLQTIYLRNDSETQRMLDNRNGWVNQVYAEINPRAARANRGNDNDDRRLAQLQAQRNKLERSVEQIRKRQPDNPRIKQGEKRLDQLAKQIKARRKELGLNKKVETAPPTADKPEFDPEGVVTRAYLRTLSRFPTSDELASSSSYLKSSEDLHEGLEGLLWALINTKEFIVNH